MAWLDALLHFFGYAVCHTLPTRSLQIGGSYLPVCARCTGIYVGVAVTYLFLISRRGFKVNALPAMGVSLALVAFLLPLAVDGATSYLGLRPTNNAIRLITGIMGGAVLPVFALPLVSPELVVTDGQKAKKIPPFKAVWEYALWLACVGAAAALIWYGPAPFYYVVAALTVLGEIAIFFNLALAVWEMALEKSKWGRRPFSAVLAALTVSVVFAFLNLFHYVSFRALVHAAHGLPPS